MASKEVVQIRAALNEPHPVEVMREIASAQLAAGVPRQTVLDEFEVVRAELDADEEKQELVMTVMDHLHGWCNPKWAL